MRTPTQTQAEDEVVRFVTDQPTPERIIDFHLSVEVADRFYALIDCDREGRLNTDEAKELDTYVYLEHLLEQMKIAAHRKLQSRAL